MTPVATLQAVKAAIRSPYAFPGGYPIYIVMADGEALSVDAAKENWRLICQSTLAGSRDGWCALFTAINWEDGELMCAHTGKRIESAYAEPDGVPVISRVRFGH